MTCVTKNYDVYDISDFLDSVKRKKAERTTKISNYIEWLSFKIYIPCHS